MTNRFPFFAVNKKGSVPEMLVYGLLGDDEGMVSAAAFVQAFKALEAQSPEIHIRINSGGGSIFEGVAIYNCISSSKADVTTYVDGMAASMASILALAGKRCLMANTARMMTHKAKGSVTGGAQAMRTNADLMDSLEDTMAGIYAAKCGMDKTKAKETFMGETDKWMTAQQALALKLIDGVYDAKHSVALPEAAASETAMWAAYEGHYKTDNHKNGDTMIELKLTAEQASKLRLGTNPTEMEAKAAMDALLAKAEKTEAAEARAVQAETAMANMKAETDRNEVETIIAEGVAARKMTVEVGNVLKAQFANNKEGLKAIVAAMPAYNPLTTQIATQGAQGEAAKLAAMSYDELDKGGRLERLKELDLNAFKTKFKERFGKEWK
jgi:ATP-dependent Clp endopeptidase proteolytic subunit ClpP